MNTLTWIFFGTVSLKVGIKVAGENGCVAQALASLTGTILSAVFNNDIHFIQKIKELLARVLILLVVCQVGEAIITSAPMKAEAVCQFLVDQ